ncbi:MAG: FecR domain-containing protein [Candidatus Rokubacteria bacterium]|nr:FecR domain-containing protein [Candidatus Rokubacteria bacterium]
MSRDVARKLVAVLLFPTLWPTLALAQEPKAGVVTTLQGQATVARPILPRPVALKFKDDVFVRDQIDTRENSIVRLLLGGKALVTIRELSAFTVTEEPGRAVVDLQSGKLAVAVSRRLLRPGESIEIRTPNAVAAVRGSLLVAEVRIVAGVPETLFTALQVTVPILVSLRADPTVSIPLGINQAVGVLGLGAASRAGSVQTITPEQAKEVGKTAEAPKPKEQSEKPPEQVAEKVSSDKVQEAAQLAAQLAPALPTAPPPPSVALAPPRTSTSDIGVQEQSSTQTAPTLLDVPDVLIKNTSKTLALGETLKTFGSDTVRSGKSPVVEVSNSTVSQSGDGSVIQTAPGVTVKLNGPLLVASPTSSLNLLGSLLSVNGTFSSSADAPLVQLSGTEVIHTGIEGLIEVAPGAKLTVTGQLLSALNSNVQAGTSLLTVAGSLTSTGSAPLLQFDSSAVTSLLTIPGSDVSLQGPLFSSTKGTVTTNFDAVSIFNGGTLTNTSTLPLIQLSGTTVNVGTHGADTHLVRVFGVLAGKRSSVTLAGALLSAADSALTVRGDDFIEIAAGAKVASTGSAALVQLTNTPLTVTGTPALVNAFLHVVGSAGGFSPELALSGPLLAATGSALKTKGSFIVIELDGIVTSTTTEPFIKLTGGSLETGSPDESLLSLETGGKLNLKGSLLSANSSTLTLPGGLVAIDDDGQLVVTGSTDPLVSITGGTHSIASTSGEAMFDLQGSATAVDAETGLTLGTDKPLQHGGALLEISGATVSGQKGLRIDTALLEATAPLLNLKAGSNLTTSTDAIDLSLKAKVTSLGPVIKLDASTLNVASGALINLAGGSFLKVTGDLFQLSNGSIINVNGLSNGFLIAASGGSILNVSGALVVFNGTGGNSIVMKNNLLPTTTLNVGAFSFPILLVNGAQSTQVSINGTPIKGSTLGSITFPNGGSLIKVDGPTAKVVISGL